jgi:hypothetical protein
MWIIRRHHIFSQFRVVEFIQLWIWTSSSSMRNSDLRIYPLLQNHSSRAHPKKREKKVGGHIAPTTDNVSWLWGKVVFRIFLAHGVTLPSESSLLLKFIYTNFKISSNWRLNFAKQSYGVNVLERCHFCSSSIFWIRFWRGREIRAFLLFKSFSVILEQRSALASMR